MKVVDCKDCGFIHARPYPSKAFLGEFYSNKYSDPLQKINLVERVERIKRLVPKESLVLDVGCGSGELLSEFKRKGFLAYGIEPSGREVAKCLAKGLNVRKGFLEKNVFGIKFNVVNLSFVLEHLPYPQAALEIIERDFLAEGGVLCLEVPNDYSLLQMVYARNADAYWVKLPDHLNYWNFRSFRAFLNQCGFHVISQTTSFPMELFLLLGFDYIKDKKMGPEMHKRRLAFEQAFRDAKRGEELSELYEAFSKLGLGRSIDVVAIRKTRRWVE